MGIVGPRVNYSDLFFSEAISIFEEGWGLLFAVGANSSGEQFKT
jgi:hypothetical protein